MIMTYDNGPIYFQPLNWIWKKFEAKLWNFNGLGLSSTVYSKPENSWATN